MGSRDPAAAFICLVLPRGGVAKSKGPVSQTSTLYKSIQNLKPVNFFSTEIFSSEFFLMSEDTSKPHFCWKLIASTQLLVVGSFAFCSGAKIALKPEQTFFSRLPFLSLALQ